MDRVVDEVEERLEEEGPASQDAPRRHRAATEPDPPVPRQGAHLLDELVDQILEVDPFGDEARVPGLLIESREQEKAPAEATQALDLLLDSLELAPRRVGDIAPEDEVELPADPGQSGAELVRRAGGELLHLP